MEGAGETIGDLVAGARRRLRAAPFQPAGREALLLMGRALGLSEAQVLARRDDPVEPAAARRFADLLARRLGGEPFAYLAGEREFFGRPFAVDRRVLVPRPESEHLVEAALALELPQRTALLDLGTGSGCLAVTLALELPAARVVASDLSLGALAVAAANARRHRVAGRVATVALDLARGLDLAAFDLVVSNPPYVAPEEAASLSPEVTGFEPAAALFAAEGGFALLRRLVEEASGLRPGAWLLLEIGKGQLERLAREVAGGHLALERAVADYAGIPRTVVLRRR